MIKYSRGTCIPWNVTYRPGPFYLNFRIPATCLVILCYNVFMLFRGGGLLTGGQMGVLFSGFLTGFPGGPSP